MTQPDQNRSVGANSRILVTGGNGFVGSAIVHQLLVQAFKVRATTRATSKMEGMKEQAEKEFRSGSLEVVEVPDLSVRDSLKEALKGG